MYDKTIVNVDNILMNILHKTQFASRTPHVDTQKSQYLAWRKFLRDSDDWSAVEVQQYQLKQIQKIIQHAYNNTRAYRESFDRHGITPGKINTLEDFQTLPFVRKEDIRDALEEFSVQESQRQYVTTGGSTGIPLGFFRNQTIFAQELASKAHQYYRVGWAEGMRQLVLRGLPIDSPDHMKFFPEFNELRCSSYHLTPQHMKNYYLAAVEFKPEFLRCYPSTGFMFAKYLQDEGKKLPSVRGVLCASENLYPHQKLLLERVFNVRVFSHYGHYEMAVLAGFCEHEDTYHVLPQYGFAELIDKQGQAITQPGQIGEIVGTSFLMTVTPFIRYRTRDFAILKGWECPSCHRPYQIWKRIDGRLQEFVVTKTGRHISMTAVNMHDDIFDHIKQFQFYQDRKGEVVFRYIPKESYDQSIIDDMRRRLLEKFGNDIELSMQEVDHIAPTKRGKHRFLIQKLNIQFSD